MGAWRLEECHWNGPAGQTLRELKGSAATAGKCFTFGDNLPGVSCREIFDPWGQDIRGCVGGKWRPHSFMNGEDEKPCYVYAGGNCQGERITVRSGSCVTPSFSDGSSKVESFKCVSALETSAS